MTTIYLTDYQYHQVLDGMISTHLDVLDNNHDGKLTQLGDGQVAVHHRQTPSVACGSPRHYVYANTDLADVDDDAMVDIGTIGLSHENDQALGYSSSELEFGGDLYGYDLETLNKVIDYYNNGGSWNDDDFEKHVYEGIGATGQLAPESVRGTANADGQMDNPIQNDQLLWNDSVCNSLDDMLALNAIDKSEMADYTTDGQGRIASITLTSGRTLWANYDLSFEGTTASFLSELQAAGATDIKYTADGMIASYTLNGKTYNVSGEFGETGADEAYTASLLGEKASNDAELASLNDELNENAEEIEALDTEIQNTEKEIEDNLNQTEEEVTTLIKAAKSKFETAVESAVQEASTQEVKDGESAKSFNDIFASKNLGSFDISSEIATKVASAAANTAKIDQLNTLSSKVSALNEKNASLTSQITDLTSRNAEIDAELGNVTEAADLDFTGFSNNEFVTNAIAQYSQMSSDLSTGIDTAINGFGKEDNRYNIFQDSMQEAGKIKGDKAVKEINKKTEETKA